MQLPQPINDKGSNSSSDHDGKPKSEPTRSSTRSPFERAGLHQQQLKIVVFPPLKLLFLACAQNLLHKSEKRALRLINLEIPVLVQSLKSSNVESLDGRLFQVLPECCC